MSKQLNRRDILNAATGAGALAMSGALSSACPARAAVTLTGVQWGGPWVETARKITARQSNWLVNWELHTGGSATIIPKVRSAWPNVPYDFIAQYDPLYYVWVQQDWPEPLTFEEMPVLRELPSDAFHRNAKGEIVNVPITLTGTIFGYRKDTMPVEIKAMEDLLDPKLKGKVIIRDAVAGDSFIVQLALAFGGNENNLEPGWNFLKKLVQSGNVGRIAHTEVDFINALTSGECVVGQWNVGGWRKVSEQFPVEFLVRDKSQAPGFQFGLVNEGYIIPKASKNKAEAKKYLNWFLSAENNQEYNAAIGGFPTNQRSKLSDFASKFPLKTEDERRRFAHKYAFDVLSANKNEIISRFETDVVPHVR